MKLFILEVRKRLIEKTDWKLLLFLVLFLNVKLIIKAIALLLVLILIKKSYRYKVLLKEKFLLFYLSLAGIATINFLLISNFSSSALCSFAMGIAFWLFAVIAGSISYTFIKNTPPEKVCYTISLFFILNLLITLAELGLIMVETGSINPYTHTGLFQKYYMNTGDFLKGIPMDVSTTNAIINSFAVVYFLYTKKYHLSVLSMIGVLIVTSNTSNLVLLITLIALFLFKSDRNQKSIIITNILLLVIFLSRVSPQNNNYIVQSFNALTKKTSPIAQDLLPVNNAAPRPLTEDELKREIAQSYLDSIVAEQQKLMSPETIESAFKVPIVNPENVVKDSSFFVRKNDAVVKEQTLQVVKNVLYDGYIPIDTFFEAHHYPGKLIAFIQIYDFFKAHPRKLILGDGMGNFSSKLAFKTTALKISGGYPTRLQHIHPDFKNNHFQTYVYFFSKNEGEHSVINTPNSVYNQILGEYGLIGFLFFVVFYLFYFIKQYKKMSFGIGLTLLLLGAFFFDYWFEQLSIVILFELLILLDIKSKNETIVENRL